MGHEPSDLHQEHHDEDHTHDHDHDHPHDHDHDHHHGTGLWGWISNIFHFHGHGDGNRRLASDKAFQDTQEGIRVIWWSLAALLFTAVLQVVIVYFSGSVSLFADTAHNIGDGLNSIPLLIAFYLVRRLPTRRYTYGFGRAEDVAGIFIVLSIAVSAYIVFSESIQRFFNPQPLTNLGWVVAASIIGFLGNEAVAIMQIRTGRKIGSAAMVADGMHARTDGLTSLAVLFAAGGSWLGYPLVDPIIGVLIGISILFITWDATKTIWYRLMDAVDPKMVERAEKIVMQNEEVLQLSRVRMRWVGHVLHAEIYICVDAGLKTYESHQISEAVRHDLFHAFKDLTEVVVHVDPWHENLDTMHELTVGHEEVPALVGE